MPLPIYAKGSKKNYQLQSMYNSIVHTELLNYRTLETFLTDNLPYIGNNVSEFIIYEINKLIAQDANSNDTEIAYNQFIKARKITPVIYLDASKSYQYFTKIETLETKKWEFKGTPEIDGFQNLKENTIYEIYFKDSLNPNNEFESDLFTVTYNLPPEPPTPPTERKPYIISFNQNDTPIAQEEGDIWWQPSELTMYRWETDTWVALFTTSSDFQNIVVVNITQLDAAVDYLQTVQAGIIYFGATITLNGNKSYNLENIEINGQGNSLVTAGYYIEIPSARHSFNRVVFSGNRNSTIFKYTCPTNVSSLYTFKECSWRNVIGSSWKTIPILDTTDFAGSFHLQIENNWIQDTLNQISDYAFGIEQTYDLSNNYAYSIEITQERGDINLANKSQCINYCIIGGLKGDSVDNRAKLNTFTTDGSAVLLDTPIAYPTKQISIHKPFIDYRPEITSLLTTDYILAKIAQRLVGETVTFKEDLYKISIANLIASLPANTGIHTTVSTTEPEPTSDGDLWFDTVNLVIKRWEQLADNWVTVYSMHNIYKDTTPFANRPKLTFNDTDTVTVTITDDSVNNQTKIEFNATAQVTLPFVTVGDATIGGIDGDYKTINEAIAAGKYNIEIVGWVNVITDIDITNKNVVISGDRTNIITFISGNIISSTLNCSLQLNNLKINNLYHWLLPRTSKNIYVNDCIISCWSYYLAYNEPYYKIFNNCDITLTESDGHLGSGNKIFNGCNIYSAGNYSLIAYEINNCNLYGTFNTLWITCAGNGGVSKLNVTHLNIYATISTIRTCNSSNVNNIINFSNCFFNNATLFSIQSETVNLVNCIRISALNINANTKLNFVNSTLSSITLVDNATLLNCKTAGLTLSGTFNSIQGGKHTTIISNANDNTITDTIATTISLATVVRNSVTRNRTTNAITLVLGNNIFDNHLIP